MGKGGKDRKWGYVSYTPDGRYIYTSYENDGRVNRYTDNGDGGHSHEYWENKDDYNMGEDPDWARYESNNSKNPEIEELQDNGDCYLTTACMRHYLKKFDDNCYELRVLRWFRDSFVTEEDIKTYYSLAPTIVTNINKESASNLVYNYIYDNVVDYCVKCIENGKYEEAYDRYKSSIYELKNTYYNRNVRKLVR